MKLGFLRKPGREEAPLVVSMTGVRLGDRVVLLSSRPGRVVETFEVDTPEISGLARDITSRLREEVRRHATDSH